LSLAAFLVVLMLFVVGGVNGTFTFVASFNNPLTEYATFPDTKISDCKRTVQSSALFGKQCTYAWFNGTGSFSNNPVNYITQQGDDLVIQSDIGCKVTTDFPVPFYRVTCPGESDGSWGFSIFYEVD